MDILDGSKRPRAVTQRAKQSGKKRMVLAAFVLAPSNVLAQDVSGPASAVDGDSLSLSGIPVRLHGIDAPEFKQTCSRSGEAWACGQEAASKLASLIEGKSVHCEQRDSDNYGRSVSACRVGQIDLAQAMIDAGLAVALPQFSDRYVASEARARTLRIGIWSSQFQPPAEYRAAHQPPPQAVRPSPTQRQQANPPRPSGVYFRNCNEARAAGAAPIYRGQPGYRPEMGGDNDGIACEPYRGR